MCIIKNRCQKIQCPTFPTTQPEAIPGPVTAFTCFYFHLVIRHGSELIWLWPGHVPGQLNHILRGAKVSFGGRCWSSVLDVVKTSAMTQVHFLNPGKIPRRHFPTCGQASLPYICACSQASPRYEGPCKWHTLRARWYAFSIPSTPEHWKCRWQRLHLEPSIISRFSFTPNTLQQSNLHQFAQFESWTSSCQRALCPI